MATPTIQTTPLQPLLRRSPERERLERKARLLAWGGIAYHFVEFAIAVGAGIAASSIALIGFGADSLIEALAGFVVLWLFTGARVGSQAAERRAQQLIAASFFVLAAFTTVTMPLLARVKRQVGHQLGSAATVKEASQTQLCAYLSIALLIGLVLSAVAGLWWADPAAALFIAAVAVKEGRESWRGEGCAEGCC